MRITGLILTLFFYVHANAQENSPYSRYGLGDWVPSQTINTRGMGGISAGYSGDASNPSVNFVNPASYGNFNYLHPELLKQISSTASRTIFDFGFEINSRTLKQIDPAAKYAATGINISYVQLGMPIRMKKANKKGVFLGINFGLRPVSRINYKIATFERLAGIDTLGTIYEGSGGLNEALFGAGIRVKNFNVGFNTGYRFGNKSYSTKLSFLNDTVAYYQSNSETKATFGGMFLTLGTQYEAHIGKGVLRLGAYTSLSQKIKGTQDVIRETIKFDSENGVFKIDSVFQSSTDGTVQYPNTWGAGFTYQDSMGHWRAGVDYEQTNWNNFSFFGQKDNVKDSWRIRAGAEYFPATVGRTPFKKYFHYVRYRAGFNYGPSYVNLGKNLPEYSISLGAGFPLKLRSGYYETQISYLNTTLEFGSRGTKSSNLRESFFRLSFGLSLSDIWFVRSKYY